MARFNFTAIDLTAAADIRQVMSNFDKIEELGITGAEVDTKIETAKTAVNTATDTKLKSYAKSNSLGSLASKKYSYGTAAPSGGADGDLYDQYF